MSESALSLDPPGIAIIQQALIWYYRAWSYYWSEEPKSCSIYAAESFVASDREVVYFVPRSLTQEDVARLSAVFGEKISFIAEELPSGQSGYCISRERFEQPTPLVQRLVRQIRVDYTLLSREVSSKRREKRRQEWSLGQSGRYEEFSDGPRKQLILTPREGRAYVYSLITNRPGEWRFSTKPPEEAAGPLSRGDYRRHWNEVGRQRLENLDLFPLRERPRLWRLARVGAGFKITRKESPSPALAE
jgi:hypothetical protein